MATADTSLPLDSKSTSWKRRMSQVVLLLLEVTSKVQNVPNLQKRCAEV